MIQLLKQQREPISAQQSAISHRIPRQTQAKSKTDLRGPNYLSQSAARSLLLLVATVAILALCCRPVAGLRRSGKCSAEREQEMDLCASRMGFLGDPSFRVPKNVTSMGPFCSQLKESVGCIHSFSRDCLEGFSRQVLTSLLKRGRAQIASVCQDDKARANMINRMSCLDDEQRIRQLHVQMDASVARFEFIAARVRPESRLSSLCCSYHIFNRDLELALDKVCGKPKQRAGSTHEFVFKVVGGTAGEFFQLICDNHRSVDECRSSKKTRDVLPKLEETSQLVAEGKVVNKNKSLIPVLLDILDTSGASY